MARESYWDRIRAQRDGSGPRPRNINRTPIMLPTGLVQRGGGISMGYEYISDADTTSDADNLFPIDSRIFDRDRRRGWQGGERIDQGRINRYFSSYFGEFEDSDPITGEPSAGRLNNWLNTNLMSPADSADPESRLLGDLMINSGRGVRGALDMIIDLSVSDPGKLTAIQMQLVNHGFFAEGPPVFGNLDEATKNAVIALIKGRLQVGDDKTTSEYLKDARTTWEDQRFGVMAEDLRATDEQAAEDLLKLKAQLEEQAPTINLMSRDRLEMSMQTMAQEQLGRRLSHAEVNALVEDTHAKQREDFYSSPAYTRYRELVNQMNTAVANADKTNDVLLGAAPDDLDRFMGAIMAQESGGDPNAVNPSGAFGLFQFMPETWKRAARAAGLDPGDRSAENQVQVARALMTQYYAQFRDWRDVAIAWYAGEGSPALEDRSFGTKEEKNGYPAIQNYADQIMQRFYNGGQLDVDESYGYADAGSLGAGQMPIENVRSWWETMQNSDLTIDADGTPRTILNGRNDENPLDAALNEVSDVGAGNKYITEYEQFDPVAYLQNAVRETGGVEADVWSFVQSAQDFYSILGSR